MRRRLRVLTFNKGANRYVSLVVEWQDEYGAWHSKVIRSYGLSTSLAQEQSQSDLEELERLASDPSTPIPTGTLGDAVWAGLRTAIHNPLLLPFAPLFFPRDLVHLGAYVIAQGSGNLAQKVAVTQPGMPADEQGSFLSWLSTHSLQDQATILAYQWRYYP